MSRLPLNTSPRFCAVGELQNLRAAADVPHLTHSAVSQQIRGLEEQLGFALFERRGRRVSAQSRRREPCCAACVGRAVPAGRRCSGSGSRGERQCAADQR